MACGESFQGYRRGEIPSVIILVWRMDGVGGDWHLGDE